MGWRRQGGGRTTRRGAKVEISHSEGPLASSRPASTRWSEEVGGGAHQVVRIRWRKKRNKGRKEKYKGVIDVSPFSTTI